MGLAIPVLKRVLTEDRMADSSIRRCSHSIPAASSTQLDEFQMLENQVRKPEACFTAMRNSWRRLNGRSEFVRTDDTEFPVNRRLPQSPDGSLASQVTEQEMHLGTHGQRGAIHPTTDPMTSTCINQHATSLVHSPLTSLGTKGL